MNEDPAGGRCAYRLRIRGFLFGLIPIIMMGAILFLSSGTFAWPGAWVVLGTLFVATLIVSLTCHPDLVMERTQDQPGVKEYDKNLVRLMNIVGLCVMFVAGLDLRFTWTGQIPVLLQAGAFVVFIGAYGLFSWAMISNRFFSLRARIQAEKGHHPVTTGPYRFVRHPGYLGFLVVVLMQPIILGSLLAVIPALVTAGLIVKRTGLEDRMLRLELEGYEGYAGTVRCRLVPGIW